MTDNEHESGPGSFPNVGDHVRVHKGMHAGFTGVVTDFEPKCYSPITVTIDVPTAGGNTAQFVEDFRPEEVTVVAAIEAAEAKPNPKSKPPKSIRKALKRVKKAAKGDSNDEEIQALQDALDIALVMLGVMPE